MFGVLPLKILSDYSSTKKLSKVNLDETFNFHKECINRSYSYQQSINLVNAAKSNENYELELSSSIHLIHYYDEEIEKFEMQL